MTRREPTPLPRDQVKPPPPPTPPRDPERERLVSEVKRAESACVTYPEWSLPPMELDRARAALTAYEKENDK